MAESERAKTRRKADASTHHEPYPARLHRHLAAAVDAAAALASPSAASGPDTGLPTPANLERAYGGVNTSESEGGENA